LAARALQAGYSFSGFALNTRFCIVRHGETDWNVEKRIQGHIDIPLNAAGLAQAEATARGLTGYVFDAAYSSDLGRAWQTAQVIGRHLNLNVRRTPDLRERHFGILQGLTAAEIAAQHPNAYQHYLVRDPEYHFATGESLAGFAARIIAAVESLASRHAGQALLLVCHGGMLDVCYRQATGRHLAAPRDFSVPNAALNWLSVGVEGWQLDSWADRRHLEQSLEESPE
jgi:probable phosphoglycerate mutase